MTVNTQPKRKPAFTLRDGALKATVWKNESEKGPWFSVDFSRGYRTKDGWRDTSSMRGDDLLKLAFLAQEAYAKHVELKAIYRGGEDGAAGEEETGGAK